MLTTLRSAQRTRRQAMFTLECLDDRLVLSAAAAGAAAGAVMTPHEARVEARHEAKLARVEARHEAKLAAFAAAHPMSPIAIEIGGSTSASSSAPAASSTSAAMSPNVTAATPVSTANVTPAVVNTTPASGTTGQTTSSGPLPANVAAPLQAVYTEYEAAGSGTFQPSQPTDKLLAISGDNVEVSIQVGSGTAFDTALSQLTSDGMQVTSSSSSYNLIQGELPISELPAAAQLASSVNPISPPNL